MNILYLGRITVSYIAVSPELNEDILFKEEHLLLFVEIGLQVKNKKYERDAKTSGRSS